MGSRIPIGSLEAGAGLGRQLGPYRQSRLVQGVDLMERFRFHPYTRRVDVCRGGIPTFFALLSHLLHLHLHIHMHTSGFFASYYPIHNLCDS